MIDSNIIEDVNGHNLQCAGLKNACKQVIMTTIEIIRGKP